MVSLSRFVEERILAGFGRLSDAMLSGGSMLYNLVDVLVLCIYTCLHVIQFFFPLCSENIVK